MRVLMIEDHKLFRDGMRLLLANLDVAVDLTEVSTMEEALGLGAEHFDLLLLDLNLGGQDSLPFLQRIKALYPKARLVVISGEQSSKAVRSAIDLGAVGFVPKTSSGEIMIKALQLVMSDGVYLPPQLLNPRGETSLRNMESAPAGRSAISREPFAGMTDRQIQVLRLALRGTPNKLIARELEISEGTVKSHLSTAFRMLDVRNRTEALYRVAQLDDAR